MKRSVKLCMLMLFFVVSISDVAFAQNEGLTPIEDVTTLTYYDIVDEQMSLSAAENGLLEQNHFVVSDEDGWKRFVDAYAWLYWKDLPVLITTDSILQTVHQSYSDLLIDLEQNVLQPELTAMLDATIAELESNYPADNSETAAIHQDLITYLKVTRTLLYVGSQDNGYGGYELLFYNVPPSLLPDVQTWFDLVIAADQRIPVGLFGAPIREVDMTMFTPRGHYPENNLGGYFLAMNWLAQIDMRFVSGTPDSGELTLYPNQIAAGMMLRSAIDDAGQRERWLLMNDTLGALVGESDNTTLLDLDQFVSDAGLNSPEDALTADPDALMTLFEQNNYGTQRITGQIVTVFNPAPTDEQVALPTSFMLFGTRFVIDSWVTSETVFDRLRDSEGASAYRALPDPNDVAYALGNDRAWDHLADDLASPEYGDALNHTLPILRETVDALSDSWWDDPVYNSWLNLIRSLNNPTQDERLPAVMQTDAWADKNLQTQLASWAQLRHDNLLYAKQSFTIDEVVCEFPDWYIEPNVQFYEALQQYAQSGSQITAQLEEAGFDVTRADEYFEILDGVATILLDMIERQLNNEPFTYEDEAFIQNMIINHTYLEGAWFDYIHYTEEIEQRWDGWYASLFYDEDDTAAVIADVHTNPTADPASALYPPRVLHVATGDVSPIYFVADKGEGPTLYVGPAFSYYEVTTSGDSTQPAERLTDEQWQRAPNATPPTWTESFRVSSDSRSHFRVDPSLVHTAQAHTMRTVWEFLFGSTEVVPGTINLPTEPSGVRVEAKIDYAGRSGGVSGTRTSHSVSFTNEGDVDRPAFTAQFFVDLSELYGSNHELADLFIQQSNGRNQSCKPTFSNLKAWSEVERIYYLTIDLRRQGFSVGDTCTVQFDIVGTHEPSEVGPTGMGYYDSDIQVEDYIVLTTDNDFSAQGLTEEWSETTFIPIYDDGVLIDGSLPPVPPVPTWVEMSHALTMQAKATLGVWVTVILFTPITGLLLLRRRRNKA